MPCRSASHKGLKLYTVLHIIFRNALCLYAPTIILLCCTTYVNYIYFSVVLSIAGRFNPHFTRMRSETKQAGISKQARVCFNPHFTRMRSETYPPDKNHNFFPLCFNPHFTRMRSETYIYFRVVVSLQAGPSFMFLLYTCCSISDSQIWLSKI
jgi:hypothetical protein